MKQIVLLFLLIALLLPSPTFAADASPSSALTQKIDLLKQEIASKAAQLKSEINKKLQNRVYTGQISEKTDNKLSIITTKGQKMILVNEYTDYQDQTKTKKTPLSLKLLAKDDYIVALGDIDDKNNLTAKKIIKMEKPKNTNKVIWGQIQSANNPIITIKGVNSQKINITTTDNTTFSLGNNEASFIDAKINKFLVVSGPSTDDKITANYIYLIPTLGFIRPEKRISTQSATPAASVKK